MLRPFFATLNFFIGGLVTVLIASLRARLLWFPLHGSAGATGRKRHSAVII